MTEVFKPKQLVIIVRQQPARKGLGAPLEDTLITANGRDRHLQTLMNGRAAYQKGLENTARGEYVKAVNNFTLAIQMGNDNNEIRLKRANALMACRRLGEAVKDLTHVLDKNPDSEAYAMRGTARALKGELDLAQTDFEASIALNPEKASSYHNLGTIMAARGKNLQAIMCWERALEKGPGPNLEATAHYLLGMVFNKIGHHSKALEHLDIALAMRPTHYAGLLQRGVAKAFLGLHNEAAVDFWKCLELQPEREEAARALRHIRRHLN